MSDQFSYRRSGKSHFSMIVARRKIMEGATVAIVSIKPDGQHHVCTVQSINTARLKPSNKTA